MADGLAKSDFKVVEELGRGSFGVVHKVKYRGDNLFYVLKTISLTALTTKKQKEALQEVNILRKIDHPHVVRYYASFIEDNTLHILMEYIDGGDLHKAIRTQRDRHRLFAETKLWRLAYEMSLAVQYLHSCRIIHRDLKPLNILVTKDGRVKVGDLGVSRIVSGTDVLRNSRVGTPLYLAPELVRQETYDFKVDIWAIGCVLYTLAQQDTPFKGENIVTLGHSIVNDTPRPLPRLYSKKFCEFVDSMIEKRAKDRPDISAVLEAIPPTVRQAYTQPTRMQPPFRLVLPSLQEVPPAVTTDQRTSPKGNEVKPKASEDATTVKLPPRGKPPLILPKPVELRREITGFSNSLQRKDTTRVNKSISELDKEDEKKEVSRPGTSAVMVRQRSQFSNLHVDALPGDVTPSVKLPAARNDFPLIYSRDVQSSSLRRKMTIKDLTLM